MARMALHVGSIHQANLTHDLCLFPRRCSIGKACPGMSRGIPEAPGPFCHTAGEGKLVAFSHARRCGGCVQDSVFLVLYVALIRYESTQRQVSAELKVPWLYDCHMDVRRQSIRADEQPRRAAYAGKTMDKCVARLFGRKPLTEASYRGTLEITCLCKSGVMDARTGNHQQ
ncbi:hypothetical protein CCM_03350 [Cordyceps militaris CM01]|uniref:Uncharacterized protein n=1 Tax=Cordyceps militaris (strain CM01) TaxID=983644 RepID=G3JAB0_CORMM|nr:uncharacterized protein CCM_03350 [Cordyceps militaris CM01]EGX95078.1 hypothetical protein CCM_03350 [Cordyceps militaris CM01]